jgi:hypothetical protein
MNIEKLNQAFINIIEKKEELDKMIKEGAQGRINQLKTELEHLEIDFEREFGHYIEEALFNVHDEYCPDNDIMLPLAYMASHYLKKESSRKTYYDVLSGEGIRVDADDFPGVKARLVLLPNPVRLVLIGEEEDFKEVVWVAR